jgi:hypothetical protein
VTTNVSYLRRILETGEFIRGETDTHLLERISLAPPSPPGEAVFEAAAALFSGAADGRPQATGAGAGPSSVFQDPFSTGAFRLSS